MSPLLATSETHWSLGTLVWLPIAATVVVILVALSVWGARRRRDKDSYDRAEWTMLMVGAGVLAVGFFVGTAVGMFPYRAEYHQFRPVHGEVTSINDRLVGSGSGMEQKFVVTFEGSPVQYGCEDTRCASVDVGDALSLSCIRSWQWAATSGYDCRFVDFEEAR